jgi:AcrR family transcriptional regulator
MFGEVYATREQALRVQRRRILDAIVLVVSERGFAGASVGAVSARAGVSRRTFYKVFDGLEDCFLVVLDEGAWYVGRVMSRAFAGERSWLDGVRSALAALLGFLDSEPALARVLLIEATAAGPVARERREQHVATLRSLVEGHWEALRDGQAHRLVNDGVIASLLGVLHTQLVVEREEPLIMLLGPMMGLVTAPYLDRRDVTAEIERGEALARELLAGRGEQEQPGHRAGAGAARPGHAGGAVKGGRGRPGGAVEVPALLRDPRAHRARACVRYLATHPEASNGEVAEAVGVAHRTQMSALLVRLQRAGILVKHLSRPGGANAWSLTPQGRRVADALVGEGHDGGLDAMPPLRRVSFPR